MMSSRLPALAVLGLLSSSLALGAEARDLPAPSTSDVQDLAEVLDPTSEARIGRLLAEIEADTGTAMEVVTMTDIARHGGANVRLEDFAARLFQATDSGLADSEDGILLLVETGTAEARIALGSGYAPVYDERAARVLSSAVLPALREGRIAAGIEAGVVAARDRLIVPFLAGTPVTAADGFERTAPRLSPAVPYALLALVAAGLAVFLTLRRVRAQKTCPRCGALTLARTFEVIEAPDRAVSGSGIEHRLCESCGHTDRKVFALHKGLLGGLRRKELK